MIRVQCKKETSTAMIPLRMHDSDAAYDLHSDESKTIGVGETSIIKTGISIQMPNDICALVLSRSGLAAKNGVFVLNSPGLIDSGYRGEIMVILHNSGDKDFGIVVGDRIAQLMFAKVEPIGISEAFELLDNTDRGTSGLGSTGVSYLGDEDEDDYAVPA